MMNQSQNNKSNKINAKAQKYAENWLPIKSILNGAIQVEGGYQVTGVKISPKNIFIMDNQSQNNVIAGIRNLYNSIDFEFWLMVADRPVDINVYLSELQLLYNDSNVSNDPAIRKLILQDIHKANLFMGKEIGVTDKEYIILFREKRPEMIQKKLQTLISGFGGAGLKAVQVSNDDLRTLLDGFLNGGSSSNFGTVLGI